MNIIVDTNIVFSSILNPNSQIGQILLFHNPSLNLFSLPQLTNELLRYKEKIKLLKGFSDAEFYEVKHLVLKRIQFIDDFLIPVDKLLWAEELVSDIDIDDTLFVALTEYLEGFLWTGDKRLINGLKQKGWNRIISLDELNTFNRSFRF